MIFPVDCQFCYKATATGTMSFPGGVRYAWCGVCRAERCWDCKAIGKFLGAPIRDDKDYRICEDCFYGTTSDRT